MAYRGIIYYSTEAQSFIWDRYQAGEAVSAIGRHFDRPSSSIHKILSRTGGIRPPVKARAPRSLSMAEREEISRGIVSGQSIREIAKILDRAPSTISREIAQNGGLRQYRATTADKKALGNAAPMRIPTVCSGITCPRGPTYPSTPRKSSIGLQES